MTIGPWKEGYTNLLTTFKVPRSRRESRGPRVVVQELLPGQLVRQVQRRDCPPAKNNRRRVSLRCLRRLRHVHGRKRKVGQVTTQAPTSVRNNKMSGMCTSRYQ